VGKNVDTATAALEALNMNVNQIKGTAAPDANSVGLVYDVNPTGPQVANGTTINLTYYGPLPVLPTPAAPTVSPQSVVQNTPVTATWGAVQCPSGFGQPTYEVFREGTSLGSGTSGFQVSTQGLAAGNYTVTYKVTCNGLAPVTSAGTDFEVTVIQ
jgi:serine/threonine-protein kinase